MHSSVADSQLIVIAYKKCLFLEINIITKFLLFRIKYIIDTGVVYLIFDTHRYFIIPMRK